jgi:mono/diheme cytochrome c family protein
MKKSYLLRLLYTSSLAGFVCLSGAGLAFGQFQTFTQNRDRIKIDTAGFPAEIQKDYGVFRDKCGGCHGLDTSLKPSLTPALWTFEVKKMQAMASSQFNSAQAKAILDFLNYDELHRKSLNKPTAQAAPSGTAVAGRQFYEAQGCDTCHAIGGKGGNAGPSLSDVGTRLSRDQISQILQTLREGKSTSMPPLPAGATDRQIKELLDYLMTLKGS